VAAATAIVFRNAVPIEPPTCRQLFTVAEATPASSARTPSVAVLIDGEKTRPGELDCVGRLIATAPVADVSYGEPPR
jgi:hypothetical protein